MSNMPPKHPLKENLLEKEPRETTNTFTEQTNERTNRPFQNISK